MPDRRSRIDSRRINVRHKVPLTHKYMPLELPHPDKALLDELNHSGRWFVAKKNRPIWAKKVLEAGSIQTLEGTEQVKPGDYICRGEGGDVWPQSSDSLNKKYTATNEVDADNWSKFEPRPEASSVAAAEVDHAFTVHSSWGELSGKPGDFIVKSLEAMNVEYPDDVWIVDREHFHSTYD
jgi:hypothetical protein